MCTSVSYRQSRLWVLLGLGTYFTLHCLMRPLLSQSLELDEAEQMLLSQGFCWGYTGQPPLYTWLQIGVFELTGRHILGLSLLKNLLLFLAYWFNYLTACRLFGDDGRRVALVTLSWFLVRQIAWEAQRDLSHSVIALALASASLFWIVRGLDRRGPLWYPLHGILLGLGVLAKYNFGLYLLAAHIALLTLPAGSKMLLNGRILIALLAMAAVVSPHVAWFLEHTASGLGSAHKLQISESVSHWATIGNLSIAVIDFLSPLWLVYAVLFWRHLQRMPELAPVDHTFIRRYVVAGFSLLALSVLGIGVGHVSDRWMTPLLFALPAAFFCSAVEIPERSYRWFRGIAVAAAMLVLLFSALRATLWPSLFGPTRLQFPFTEFAGQLVREGFTQGIVIADSAHVAGNLLHQIPALVAYTPSVGVFAFSRRPTTGNRLLVVWNAEKHREMPEKLVRYLRTAWSLQPEKLKPVYYSQPYRYSYRRMAVLGVVELVRDGP